MIESCPTWVCNESGVPHDIFYFISFLLIAIPYLFFIAQLYKSQGIVYSQRKSYFFYLLAPVGLYLYFALLFGLFISLKHPLFEFLASVLFGSIMWMLILIPIIIACLLIVLARKSLKGK